ncbi:MAG: RNA polymerase sigma factor [Gemmataceae bacterium]|nr:RNA polymerase sigma factor [Gemmataceae bacterium]
MSGVPEQSDTAASVKDVEAVYRSESRRVFATLVRLVGDFDLAEESLHEAFVAALERWPVDGVPTNPRAWLVAAARFKAIDTIRRQSRFAASLGMLAARRQELSDPDEEIPDDRLRLIFTCCHPALAPATQIALTLREVCDLTTEEIAGAFLTAPATIAQRIVRGKARIRETGIPYVVPELAELPERLDSVLAVIYLVFNEGYSASSGESVTREPLIREAIRLARLLVELLPDAEAIGLLGLMLLHESRRPARTDPSGDLILLEFQDRTLWDQSLITEGRELVHRALRNPPVGVYTLQAAISALHSASQHYEATDWAHIVEWYDLLRQADPSPVVQLNRAVAVAMRDGPDEGLRLMDDLEKLDKLENYHLFHAARADLLRRAGRASDARKSYFRALDLTMQEPERRFLERQIRKL